MAYVEKYSALWRDFRGHYGTLYIDQLDYSGASTKLKLYSQGGVTDLEIERPWNGDLSYILGTQCSFSVVNDFSDYFEIFDLMIAENKKYRVRVVAEDESPNITLFEGFINVEAASQKYVGKHPLRIIASNYLSQLAHVYPESFDVLQNKTFIDIIREALDETGSEYDIYVNASIYADGDTVSVTQTFLNKTGIYTETFWKNNIDRKSSEEIIESILKTFNCYLYCWNNKWYIEHYKDIWNTSIDYVKYEYGSTYGVASNGVLVNEVRTIVDTHTFQFTQMSQMVRVDVGRLLVQIRLNYSKYLNLTINDFSNVIDVAYTVLKPVPPLRTWWCVTGVTGLTFWNILGSGSPFRNISNSIMRTIGTNFNDDWDKGLYTTIEVSVTEETKLDISWKYSFVSLLIADVYPFSGDIEDYSFEFRYNIRTVTGDYVYYDEDNGVWDIKADDGNGDYDLDVTQKFWVKGDEFDAANLSVEISKNVNLGEIAALVAEDYTQLTIHLGVERVLNDYWEGWADVAYIGDFNVSASFEEEDDDIIEGKANNKFIVKETIELDMADVSNHNYKNGIRRGTDLLEMTNTWTYDGVTKHPLIDWMLINKFRLYDTNRQIISSNIVAPSNYLRPFQLVTEQKQASKKFVMGGYKYKPNQGIYVLTLHEYDSETVVNLNE